MERRTKRSISEAGAGGAGIESGVCCLLKLDAADERSRSKTEAITTAGTRLVRSMQKTPYKAIRKPVERFFYPRHDFTWAAAKGVYCVDLMPAAGSGISKPEGRTSIPTGKGALTHHQSGSRADRNSRNSKHSKCSYTANDRGAPPD